MCNVFISDLRFFHLYPSPQTDSPTPIGQTGAKNGQVDDGCVLRKSTICSNCITPCSSFKLYSLVLNRRAVALVNLLKLDNSRLASSIKHRRVLFIFSAIIVNDSILLSTWNFQGVFLVFSGIPSTAWWSWPFLWWRSPCWPIGWPASGSLSAGKNNLTTRKTLMQPNHGLVRSWNWWVLRRNTQTLTATIWLLIKFQVGWTYLLCAWVFRTAVVSPDRKPTSQLFATLVPGAISSVFLLCSKMLDLEYVTTLGNFLLHQFQFTV